MKTLVLLILFIAHTNAFAQSLDKFYGFRFGCSSDSVKKAMLLKPGCTFNSENSTSTKLIFEGVKFAGRKTMFIMFSFINNKLHSGNVYIMPELSSEIIELYSKIKDELNEKYYKSEKDFEMYMYPFKKTDGDFETAIKAGKTKIMTFWMFKNPKSETQQNGISIEITNKMYIVIEYQDGVLAGEEIDKIKKKNFSDY